jgi:hypothetical protein
MGKAAKLGAHTLGLQNFLSPGSWLTPASLLVASCVKVELISLPQKVAVNQMKPVKGRGQSKFILT